MSAPITFIECQNIGYKARTEENILQTDGTLAIYVDGTTFGEKVTKQLCLKHSKPFFEFDLLAEKPVRSRLDYISEWIEENCIYALNIAGNGIYTFKNKLKNCSQKYIDDIVFSILSKSVDDKINKIQSGGQTGVDEAGIKYALIRGIEAKIVAPKGWVFRDENGVDHYNEKLFKQRFLNEIIAAAEGAEIPERD